MDIGERFGDDGDCDVVIVEFVVFGVVVVDGFDFDFEVVCGGVVGVVEFFVGYVIEVVVVD